MTTFRILHVDDDEIEREAVARSLARADLASRLLSAANGIEAIELLRANRNEVDAGPCLVLLDWKMPCMNGYEFLQEIRDDPELRNTVVFVLSTSADSSDRDAAYDQLVAAYIVKDRAGENFDRLTALLRSYRDVVELPGHDGLPSGRG